MTNKYIPKLPALHSGQQKVKDSEARWKILCAGRRFGKTRLGVQLCMEVALKGGRAWWVAPTFSIARVGWRDIAASAKSFPREIEPNVSLANMQIDLPNGGSIAVRSADNPQRLRGEGLDYLVMDEAAFVKPEVWQEVLRPTLQKEKVLLYLLARLLEEITGFMTCGKQQRKQTTGRDLNLLLLTIL